MHSANLMSTNSKLWSESWQAIARGRLWFFLLMLIGSSSSIVYAHAPSVAFATTAGVTLTRRRAVASAMAIWLVNQVYGYTLRHYPRTPDSLAWGLLMGVGTLLVTLLATLRPSFSQRQLAGHLLWVGIAVVGGFVLFEGMILFAFPLLTNGHSMGWNVLLKLFVKDMFWTGMIALCHGLLVGLTARFSSHSSSNQYRTNRA